MNTRRYSEDRDGIIIEVYSNDRSFDMERQRRGFTSLNAAQKFAQRFLGPRPSYILDDGATDSQNRVTVKVSGVPAADLFPDLRKPYTESNRDYFREAVDLQRLQLGEKIYKAPRSFFDKAKGVPEQWIAEKEIDEGGFGSTPRIKKEVCDSPRNAKVAIVGWRNWD